MSKIRAALYLRVSTSDQSTDMQKAELERVCEFKGWEIVKTYSDDGVSGTKSRDKRPGLDAALTGAQKHSYDVLLVWALDRLGRSLQGLLHTLESLQQHNADLYVHKQQMDTSVPSGKLLFSLVGAFAEFERETIRERVSSGIARAKVKGTKTGIAHGRPKLKGAARVEIENLLLSGAGINAVAEQLGRGNGTVARVREELIASGRM